MSNLLIKTFLSVRIHLYFILLFIILCPDNCDDFIQWHPLPPNLVLSISELILPNTIIKQFEFLNDVHVCVKSIFLSFTNFIQ